MCENAARERLRQNSLMWKQLTTCRGRTSNITCPWETTASVHPIYQHWLHVLIWQNMGDSQLKGFIRLETQRRPQLPPPRITVRPGRGRQTNREINLPSAVRWGQLTALYQVFIIWWIHDNDLDSYYIFLIRKRGCTRIIYSCLWDNNRKFAIIVTHEHKIPICILKNSFNKIK